MDRFWSKVKKSNDCWEWAAAKDRKGYGRFFLDGKHVGAHRVALFFEGVDIPSGMCVMHSCDNPGCVNPDHLSIGTIMDNAADMMAKGRNKGGWLNQDGEKHHNSKLTEADVREIRSLRGLVTQKELAKKFGVNQGQISAIQLNKFWSHV